MKIQLTIFVLAFFVPSLAQDPWESYEDSQSYENEVEIDIEEAKKYFCTEVKDVFLNCTAKYFWESIDRYNECFEKIGLKANNMKDAVEEACLPETPTDVGVKFRDCKNAVLLRMEQEVEGSTLKLLFPADVQAYMNFCIPLRELLLDEGWFDHFTKGPLVVM